MLVRVYLSEAGHAYEKVIALLREDGKIRGVTAFRGIAGFGDSGRMHETSLLDLSLDNPIVVEFFDRPERVEPVLAKLETLIKPGHIISWPILIHS